MVPHPTTRCSSSPHGRRVSRARTFLPRHDDVPPSGDAADRARTGRAAPPRPDPPSKPAAAKIARPVPLRESVFEALLELIISGSLRPGRHLAESELAEMLGVSRQPIREALQLLSGEGWVDLFPGHGAFVHALTAKEADQLLAVRTLLEAEAARLAARNHTEEEPAQPPPSRRRRRRAPASFGS
ncbi:GntR family transcriptional regulator [Sphaerisporangium sp. NPDC005289]|uniref:GntR family transcriptional regulator n=1 Tax=Sphaerisporangium sp. NPDC005289 TaxID=3155247 RepID=UPI0033AB9799